jgi:predicted GNAT family N-acyltransferase
MVRLQVVEILKDQQQRYPFRPLPSRLKRNMSNPEISNVVNNCRGPGSASSYSDNSSSSEPFQFRLATTKEEIQQCQSLRHAIFVQEQKVPLEAEYDGNDDQAFHIVCYGQEQDDTPDEGSAESPILVATGRVLVVPVATDDSSSSQDQQQSPPGSQDTILQAVLGRIAVRSDHRGKGLGRRVVRELERIAQTRGAVRATLTPHHYLERFYARLSYFPSPVEEGHNRLIHINEHCQLIAMEKRLL